MDRDDGETRPVYRRLTHGPSVYSDLAVGRDGGRLTRAYAYTNRSLAKMGMLYDRMGNKPEAAKHLGALVRFRRAYGLRNQDAVGDWRLTFRQLGDRYTALLARMRRENRDAALGLGSPAGQP